ncbi:MAG: hypothetical protein RL077_1231 [Verrucomicrobiota bacterium]
MSTVALADGMLVQVAGGSCPRRGGQRIREWLLASRGELGSGRGPSSSWGIGA